MADDRYGERPIWWLIAQRMRGTPSIVSILMRSGTVGSEAQRRIVREQADYLFEPPLPDIGLARLEEIRPRHRGRLHAHAARIEQHGVPLTNVWTEGPAVAIPHKEAVS